MMKVFAIIGIISTIGVCLVVLWCILQAIRQAILRKKYTVKIQDGVHTGKMPDNRVWCFGQQQDGECAVEMTNEEWEKKQDESAEIKKSD